VDGVNTFALGDETPKGEIKSLCIFSGSRVGQNGRFQEAAVRLGEMMAERGIRMVYGGGNIGLMGLAATAVLQNGGQVVGVIPEFLMSLEVGNPGVTELVVVETMHERKAKMYELSDGFVVLPGGLGTLDETLEIATWKQLQLHAKPIVTLNIDGFWDPLSGLLDHVVAGGFAHPDMPRLISSVDTVDDVLDAISNAPAPDRRVLLSHIDGD
jgi:uncharacterized protein (TIGR00730 family)